VVLDVKHEEFGRPARGHDEFLEWPPLRRQAGHNEAIDPEWRKRLFHGGGDVVELRQAFDPVDEGERILRKLAQFPAYGHSEDSEPRAAGGLATIYTRLHTEKSH